MIKLETLIESIGELKTFSVGDNLIEPRISDRLKEELLEMLTEIQFDIKSKETNDVSKIQLENTKQLTEIYKERIGYLEDFIVRIARESKDL